MVKITLETLQSILKPCVIDFFFQEHMAKIKPSTSDGASASTSSSSGVIGTSVVGQPVPATGMSGLAGAAVSATPASLRPVNDSHVDAVCYYLIFISLRSD